MTDADHANNGNEHVARLRTRGSAHAADRAQALQQVSDPARDLLGRVCIVLVEPQGPRNIGSVARAMRNFGLSRLVLVNPTSTDHPECKEMAVGAYDLITNARVVATLDEAVETCGLVVATTARQRHRIRVEAPEAAAATILAGAVVSDVAILFGREDSGLTTEEMARCQMVISIDASPAHAVLNLAQAVLIVAYELFRASGAPSVSAQGRMGRVLTAASRVILEDELMRALGKLRVVNESTAKIYRDCLTRLLTAGTVQTRDARVLFALARHASKLADPSDPGPRPPRTPRPRPPARRASHG